MAERENIFVPSPIPDKLANLLEGYHASKTLFAACELRIFDRLHSATISSELDATTRLMDALVGLEFLEKTKDGDQWVYKNSQIASKFLTSSSPESQLGMIGYKNNVSYTLCGQLESAVREGTPRWMKAFGKSSNDVFQELYHTEESCLQFMRALHSDSLHGSYAVAKGVDLSKFRTCCDLGGEHYARLSL